MKDQSKTKQALIKELTSLREKITELEQSVAESRRTAEALRESEAKYRLAYESTSDGIFTIDRNFNILSITPSVERQLGYKVEEVINRPIQDLNILTSESLARAVSDVIQVLSGAEITGKIYEFIAKDGTRKIGEVTGTPIIQESRIIGVAAIVRDITERKKAEEALRQEHSFRNAIIDNVAEGLCVCHETTEYPFVKFTVWNDCMIKITGYTMEEINSLGWYQTVYPDPELQAKAIERMKRMRQSEDLRAEEWEITRADRSERVLNISTSVVESNDGVVHVLALMQDITERKRAEEALRKSEELYRTLSENSPSMIYLLDVKGSVLVVNQQSAAQFGLKPDAIIGRNIRDLFPEQISERHKQALDKLLRDGKNLHGELSESFPTGERWIDARLVPVWNKEKSKIIAVLGISHDITDRKRAEEKIRTSLREKDILLSEIHHRVKNNLQVISGLLSMQARASTNPELTERFQVSQNQIQAMAMVHEKLYNSRDFSRIDLAGYVRSLSGELFQSFNIHPGKRDLTIQTDGEVYVDINKAIPCGLIMNELISNALKHAFSGDGPGNLQIILRETKDREIEMVIRDDGLGLPDDVDIHEPRSVGLHLVNGLVKNQLHGQIEVRRDNGTEFRITIHL